MIYIGYKIYTPSLDNAEIIMAMLADDFQFESFTDYDRKSRSFEGYVTLNDEMIDETKNYLTENATKFERNQIEDQNWNAVWESSFDPIQVDDLCTIRAHFHQPTAAKHEIIITPKMSFGTGHHPTTHMMVQMILRANLNGLSGLDMGSGTAVLAILATQCGAKTIDAVDIDEWAYHNAIENIEINNTQDSITPILGDATAIKNKKYQFILANINRNILLNDMQKYVDTLDNGGKLIVSGILEIDVEMITECAVKLGLKPTHQINREGWSSIEFTMC